MHLFSVLRLNGSVVETSDSVDKETREFLGKAAEGIVSGIILAFNQKALHSTVGRIHKHAQSFPVDYIHTSRKTKT